MIRVPAALVGTVLTLTLGAGVFVAARLLGWSDLPAVLLPVCSLVGGYVAGRWGEQAPLVWAFGVGLFAIAARVGLALGLGLGLTALVPLRVTLLELCVAVIGGVAGALTARRAAQPEPEPQPEYTPL
jgi:hypothetical protein